MSSYSTLLRAVVLAGAVASALALYFALTLYVFPQSFQSIELRRPEVAVTGVSLSASEVKLGEALGISVAGTNSGEEADMQIVSIGFPNLTSTENIRVTAHNFAQTPIMISAGDEVGSGYTGEDIVAAQYASIEAFSRPWPGGNSYSIDLEVVPESEGRFAIFVKSVAFPHSWGGAHWPQDGLVDYQQEFVEVHYVQVTNP